MHPALNDTDSNLSSSEIDGSEKAAVGTTRELRSDRLAAIDVGTNSFHLVVVKLLPDQTFAVLNKEKIGVRLGESARQIKHLTEEAMTRGVEAMKLFSLVAERMEAPLRAVATSAVREAENADVFLDRVRKKTGIEIEIVSGSEEARLIYLGVLQALPVIDQRIALFDIGGGSTEILVGEDGKPLYANSFKIGAIRMTQRFFPKEAITPEEADRLRLYLRGEIYFAAREVRSRLPEKLIASSGTAMTVAAMIRHARGETDVENLNGTSYTLEEVRETVARIVEAESFAARAEIPGCDPRRADILAAGAIVLETMLTELGFDAFTISGYALREGIILDTIRKRGGDGDAQPSQLYDLRYESVIKLGRTYNFDEQHALHVAELALKLYDELAPLHRLEESSRELLEAAAILHDIGYYISHSSHHKHALYMICNSQIMGFTVEEISVIANVARYHRKSHPKTRHPEFALLSKVDKKRVKVLAGILRIADGLDRTHRNQITDVTVTYTEKAIEIVPHAGAGADPTFEFWSAERKKGLLADVFNREVTLRPADQS